MRISRPCSANSPACRMTQPGIFIILVFLVCVNANASGEEFRNTAKFKTGGIIFTDAKFGKGCLINSAGEIVKLKITSPLNKEEGTIEVWIKPLFSLANKELPNDYPFIVSISNTKIKAPTLPPTLAIHFTPAGTIAFQIVDTRSANNQFILSSQPLNWASAEEHFIAASWKKDIMRLYIDGQEISSLKFNSALLKDIFSEHGEEIYFGNHIALPRLYSATVIDGVRVSNSARTAQEIRQAYQDNKEFVNDKKTIFIEGFNGPDNFSGLKSDIQRKTTASEWQIIKENAKFKVYPEVSGAPINVGSPVNTLGWEDSASISPDGSKLLFTYVPFDMISAMARGEYINGGPVRRPNNYGGDSYICVKDENGGWLEPVMLEFSTDQYDEVGPELSYDEGRIYFSGTGKGGYGQNDIWVAQNMAGSWKNVKNLGSPPNSELFEEDPSISVDEDELYFWSKEPASGGYEDYNIWMSQKKEGQWLKPVKLEYPINTEHVEMQPFLTWDGNWLYFSSNRSGKPCIYRARRDIENGGWINPEVVVEPVVESSVIGAGEPTLTADGKYLYFVAAYKSSHDEYDCDIHYVKLKE